MIASKWNIYKANNELASFFMTTVEQNDDRCELLSTVFTKYTRNFILLEGMRKKAVSANIECDFCWENILNQRFFKEK